MGVAQFHVAVLVGDDAGVAHLAACSRNGEHGGQRQHRLRSGLAQIEVPHVAVVGNTVADGFHGVDDAASTYGKQEVDTFAAAEVDALVHFRQAGIGHYAAQRDEGDALFLEQVAHFVEQS